MDFTIKDSGQREEFATGSRRDVEDGKLDFTLLQFEALARDAAHMMKGAVKYGRHNWTKGQSMARAERSMVRHLFAYLRGERDEDHLAALRFNSGLIMDHEVRIARGELSADLDDRDDFRRTVAPTGKIDEETRRFFLNVEECYRPGTDMVSPHIGPRANGDGDCVGCGIDREGAAKLGHRWYS